MAQASCPQFIDSSFMIIHPLGDADPTHWQIRIKYYNPTSGAKSFQFSVTCGGVNVLLQCVDASHFQNVITPDTSNMFVCSNISGLVVKLIAYTANNTNCQGGSCVSTSVAGAPLPVYFKEFGVLRKGALVNLHWTTASEDNNNVFVVERKTGNNDWFSVGYVNSSAPGGTSSFDLNYSFTDQNGTSETSLYRLKQVDIDGQFFYSEVRAVEGLKPGGSIISIYPNPGRNGQITVSFKYLSRQYNLTLIDANGRMLEQWSDVHGSSFHITSLLPGWYNLLVIEKESGKQTAQKFVILR